MMKNSIDLLLLIVPFTYFFDAIAGDLAIIIVEVGGFTYVTFVVLAHTYFLYTFLLVILLPVKYRC